MTLVKLPARPSRLESASTERATSPRARRHYRMPMSAPTAYGSGAGTFSRNCGTSSPRPGRAGDSTAMPRPLCAVDARRPITERCLPSTGGLTVGTFVRARAWRSDDGFRARASWGGLSCGACVKPAEHVLLIAPCRCWRPGLRVAPRLASAARASRVLYSRSEGWFGPAMARTERWSTQAGSW